MRHMIFDQTLKAILSVNESLSHGDVTEISSLTQDLGMDSLRLASLIALIKSEIANIDLTPWYVQASRQGHDTVASLVDFVAQYTVAQAA